MATIAIKLEANAEQPNEDVNSTQRKNECCPSNNQHTAEIIPEADNKIEPTTAVSASQKLYHIDRLRKFGHVPFVIKRMDLQDHVFSYDTVVSSVEIILNRLRCHAIPHGIGIAFRIAYQTPAFCVLVLAILNHKCHFYAVDKMILSKEMKIQLCRADIEYLIVSGHMNIAAACFERIGSFLIYNEEFKLLKLIRSDDDPQPEAASALPQNMCYTISTTGTTGQPKLVHVPYESILPNIIALSQKLNVSMADIIYMGTPCTFDPFVVELFLALYNGAAVLVSHFSMRESPTRVLGALFPASVTTPGISILQMTPSLFRQFGSNAIRECILNNSSSLRVLLLGGEPFPSNEELCTWMQPQVLQQKQICNIYGITELSCWSTLHILQSLHARVPLGLPIDDETVLRIDYKRNRKLEHAGKGELLVGSVTRRCYIPEIDDVQQPTEDVCYRATGDLVRRYEDGSICYEERANDVVKRAGNRISLGHITSKIQKCLSVHELVTCLWQEEPQRLICCIRSTELKNKIQQRAQTFDILSKLMAAEQPDRFVYLQHFPFNSHGKLDQALLLRECVPLTQPGQEILKTFVQDTLKCVDTQPLIKAKKQKLQENALPDKLSVYELSFRQAGGTSFHAITLSREIGMQMCIDDEQRYLFELLLDEAVPLSDVLRFLNAAKLVAHNTKLKPIEAASSNISSTNNSLVITRIEQPSIHFNVHWKVNFNKCIDSPVTHFQGRYISVGAHSKLVRTLDARTGQIQSSITLPDRVECKVSFINETLAMVGCYDGCLYAFNPLSGALVWQIEIGGMIKAQPFISADGTRIVVCSYAEDYNVICVSTEQQAVLWCIRIGEKPIIAAPLEIPNTNAAIICTLDGSYARVSLSDGTLQWSRKCKEPFFGTPVLLDAMPSIFLCAEVAGRVHACHVATGEILATYVTDGHIFSSMAIKSPPTYMGHSFVLFGCTDKHLHCIRCKTRMSEPIQVEFELHWKLDMGAAICATPILLTLQHSSYLVCGCATDGRIVLANLSDGQVQWSQQLPGEIFSTPCYIQCSRRFYVGCRDNYLYCLGL